MKTRVELADQVLDFVGTLAPQPRRSLRLGLRLGLRGLEREHGDIKPLEGDLSGWCRLRVGSHRVIFRFEIESGARGVFAERRAVVYELFADAVRQTLAAAEKKRG